MALLWIVHRSAQQRAVLTRLVGAGDDSVLGAPGAPLFDRAPVADVVLLDLLGRAGDFEVELQFAHRCAPRLRGAAWILLVESGSASDAVRLFDSVDPEILTHPVDAGRLRQAVEAVRARSGARPLALSERPARDDLARRFSLWFSDMELPEVMRALDPRLADVPLLLRGEPGTGKGLLLRYVHAMGGTSAGALVRVSCSAETELPDLRDAMVAGASLRARSGCSIWLEDVDRLAPDVQRVVQDWIEFGPPEGVIPSDRVRWCATLSGPDDPDRPVVDALEPALAEALSGLSIRIPPLRERPHLIAAFAGETSDAWCAARGGPARTLDASARNALEAHSWPGNLHELEAVVLESLSSTGASPLTATDLRYRGRPFPDASTAKPTGEEATTANTVAIDPPASEAVIDVEDVLIERLPDAESASDDEKPGDDTAARDALQSDTSGARQPDAEALRRLAGSVAHEVRNPLSSIRTFSQLLAERYDDPDFRSRFAEIVGADVSRLADVVERLSHFGALPAPIREPVDVAQLLQELLEAEREVIRERELLVLEELDRDQPLAIGDGEQLRFALAALVQRTLRLVPPRGDLFLASRYHPGEAQETPALRILLRFGHTSADPGRPEPLGGLLATDNSLEIAIADWVVRAQGGTFTYETSPDGETLIVIDLLSVSVP